jgi:tRNA threonylcarbamoyladenosine biosynthesis protein TsaB
VSREQASRREAGAVDPGTARDAVAGRPDFAPLLLGVDTSGRWAGLALSRGEEPIAELVWRTGLRHTAELFPNLERLLQIGGHRPVDLHGLVVCTGPGTFNGLRAGVSAVKGLAAALAIPVIGVSSFETRALQAAAPGLVLCPAFSSGQRDLAAAAYRWSNEELVTLLDPVVAPLDEWIERLPPRTVVIGELRPEARGRLVDARMHVLPESLAAPRVSQAIRLAWPRWQAADFDDPRSLQPNYLRPPQITRAGRSQPDAGHQASASPP